VYSKDGPITEASVLIDKDNGGEYRGYTFEQIARSVLGKHVLKIRWRWRRRRCRACHIRDSRGRWRISS
jgi:hypothetical protein